VKRVAIGGKRVRHEAVVGRIAHRGMQDPVHEQRARGLVEFILHRLTADRHLDDDVEALGRIFPDGDHVDAHGQPSFRGSAARRPVERIRRLALLLLHRNRDYGRNSAVRRPFQLAPPSTLMVKAITPMLKTKAANECSTATARMRLAVIATSEVWNVMPRVKAK